MTVKADDPGFLEAVDQRHAQIASDAPCTQCGLALSRCTELHGPGGPEHDPAFPGCCCFHGTHRKDPAALDGLLQEIKRGEIHTVAELTNRLNDRPHKPAMLWLVHQGEWWQPEHGPMTRVVDMTDTHRYHLIGWLERRAPGLALSEEVSWMMGPQPSGDAACEGFEEALNGLARDPVGWLRETELYQALAKGLPDPRSEEDRARHEDLVARAKHWSTCPANRDLQAGCTCEKKTS